MKRSALAIACVLAAACGGGGGSKGNPATNTTFDYQQATTTTPPPGSVEATASALGSLSSFDATPDALRASNVIGALFDAGDQALGGSSLFGVAPISRALPLVSRVRAEAITLGGMPDSSLPAGCGVVSNGSVTFDPAVCKVIDDSTPGEHLVATIGGHVTRLSAGAAEWRLALSVSMSNAELSLTATLDDAGSFSLAPGSTVAHEEAGIRASARASNGQSATIAMAQAADLAVSTAPVTTCANRIVGGTFEAKRVWTEVPQQLRDQDPDAYRSIGVRITWTSTPPSGCGVPTAQVVVR